MTLARNRRIEIDGERPRVVSLGLNPRATFIETPRTRSIDTVVELQVSALGTISTERFQLVDPSIVQSVLRRQLLHEITEALASGRVSTFRTYELNQNLRQSPEIDVLRLKVAMLEQQLKLAR